MNRLKPGETRQRELPVYPVRLQPEDEDALRAIMTKGTDKNRIEMFRRLLREEHTRLKSFEQQERQKLV